MNILIVSSYLPYPLFSGGHIRLYNLIKELSQKHTITLVCEKRKHQTAHDNEEVKKFCKRIITVERKKQWTVKNIIKTGLSFNPFLITGHKSSEMKRLIADLLTKEHFDVIHVETFYVLQNVPETHIPIVLVEHNIEYLVYKRYLQRAPFFLRPLLGIDVMKLKINEERAWKRATKLVAVSQDEKVIMAMPNVTVVPNGVDIEQFVVKKQNQKQYTSMAKRITLPEKEILFIGDFKWVQNRDTVRWIMQDIWPYLLRAVEGEIKMTLRIVGKNIPEGLKMLKKYDSILFDENAPKQTAEIFSQADILLSPIRVGGGTSYKILEAMATGVPVVTTSLGNEGLGGRDGKEIIVADDVQTIVEKTARILRDDELYKNIAEQARKLIEEKYEWKKIAKVLDGVYESTSEG
jgi:polysaccharide biosynthesis protein PslH